jgi:serine/threonine protein kinase/tetratricopeptide (TPR) repeat protein
MPLAAGTQLGRYKILAPLGKGGMGEVYRAQDTTLDREVAIKVLPERLLSDAEARTRFEREGKVIAALSHPNILEIHDFGIDNGIPYAVTELLQGETLRETIAKSPLRWQRAIEIGIAVTEGLAAAHSKGVTHRDLKPENILLTSDGRVKILDFGLAQLKQEYTEENIKESPTISHHLESEIVRGTLPYMSPEQIRGEKLDARTDIFSFGCILYETITGQRPFSGNTNPDLISLILNETPPPLTDRIKNVPPELDRLIQHCLNKSKQQRLQSSHDLALDLKALLHDSAVSASIATRQIKQAPAKRIGLWLSLLVIVSIAVLVSLNVGRLREKLGIAHPLNPMESLAVLPLRNLSPDPQQEYFADGMTEELIAKLSRIESLRIISRTSVMGYKNVKKPINEIAKELNVDWVIEGSVLPAGDRVRITLQLIDAQSDRHLWAESYEHDLKDILALQNEVALSVAREIKIQLTPQAQKHLTTSGRVSPEAYQAYLRAMDYSSRFDLKSLNVAENLFQKSIEFDSTFAPAYAGMSQVHSKIYFFGYDKSQERLMRAKQSVDRAFELQPDLPEARLALAFYFYHGLRNFSKALQEFETVKKIMPSNTSALQGIAFILRRQGDFHKAEENLKDAAALSPNDHNAIFTVGEHYLCMGRYDDAIHWFNRDILIAPDQTLPYHMKAMSYLLWKEDWKMAKETLNEMPLKEGIDFVWSNFFIELGERNYEVALKHVVNLPKEQDVRTGRRGADLWRGIVYRLMNQPGDARAAFESERKLLERILKQDSENFSAHSSLGIVYAGLGLKEAAIQEGKKAVELLPVSKDAVWGPACVLDLAIIYTMVGEQDAALDQIEYLFSIPPGVSGFSAARLKFDPQFDPLRSNPRFQKLLAKHSTRE